MTHDEIKTLDGKAIILRRKNFIGKDFDIECIVSGIMERSVMCKWKGCRRAFVPKVFFLEERAKLDTSEGKSVVYLPHWFHW